MPPASFPARCFRSAVQAVDVPVRFQVDERDHVARFALGNQDQPAITGTLVFLLCVPAPGNPGIHLLRRAIGERHFMGGTIEDIDHVVGIRRS